MVEVFKFLSKLSFFREQTPSQYTPVVRPPITYDMATHLLPILREPGLPATSTGHVTFSEAPPKIQLYSAATDARPQTWLVQGDYVSSGWGGRSLLPFPEPRDYFQSPRNTALTLPEMVHLTAPEVHSPYIESLAILHLF